MYMILIFFAVGSCTWVEHVYKKNIKMYLEEKFELKKDYKSFSVMLQNNQFAIL